MNLRRAAACLACFTGSLLVGGPVSAQQADGALSATAKQLYSDAAAARTAENWPECYAKARAAWGAQNHVTIAGILGDCAHRVGRAVEGATHLAIFLDNPPAKATPDLIKYVQERLAAAKQDVATVHLDVSIHGSRVTIDTKAAPELPATLYLEPAEHVFRTEHPHHSSHEERLVLAPNSEQTLLLKPGPKSEPNHHGDGGGIGYAPGVAVLSVGLVGVAAGIGLLVAADGKLSDADSAVANLRLQAANDAPCAVPTTFTGECATIKSLREDHDAFLGVGHGFLVGGGLAALTGSVLIIVHAVNASPTPDGPAPPAKEAQLGPWLNATRVGVTGVGVTGVGVTWEGRF